MAGLSAACLLSACGTIDNFSGRTTRYNVAASDTKSRAILMNVMRAAYREPLQFSDVSTVTGQSSLSGSLEASLPLAVSPAGTAKTFTLTPNASASGSSQFNVTNLNTQEFYNGLQTPLSLLRISNLIDAGYDPTLVLFLAVSDLDIQSTVAAPSDGKPGLRYIAIHSNADTGSNIGTIYYALDGLVQTGFSIQPSPSEPYGPVMTAKEVQDNRLTSAVLASATSDLSLAKTDDGRFQFERSGGFDVCFDPLKVPLTPEEEKAREDLGLKGFTAYRAKTKDARFAPMSLVLARYTDPRTGARDVPVPDMTLPIRQKNICGYKPDKAAKAAVVEADQQSFALKTRSLEGIFQLLGTIARKQNGIGRGTKTEDLAIGTSHLFRVQTERPVEPSYEVTLHGATYYVAIDPHGESDYSSQVLQIVTDLLALQSSAKDIPVPGVISVLGR